MFLLSVTSWTDIDFGKIICIIYNIELLINYQHVKIKKLELEDYIMLNILVNSLLSSTLE